ncbi:hypothetical protein BAE44_0014304 [Dichanthelium oligosanthes]|uniref:DUF4228 domain-containing protein n=1 Tax=Dichanthelium oligosanthes TaxID=888268 RepID=A0A1E5VHU2_9POAL|nr:hypothetical protein BAE44_0014304 [Dichanthelium oligosanthes]
MGCGFSSATSPGALRPCAGVRVIHTNGYVEDFLGPGVVTVAHVTACYADGGKGEQPASPRYVLCSSAHLLQPGRGPFRPDDQLQPGTVYFLLPQSVFQSESSAVDLACLMNRLTALARKGCATAAPAPNPVEALFAGAAVAAAASPQRHLQQQLPAPKAAAAAGMEPGRPAPWRPRLDRIDESIGRASMRSASSRSACSEA